MTPDKTPMQPCGECSMLCDPKEYHPYAACLMFKACHNSETVRANLEAVRGSPVVAGEPTNSGSLPEMNKINDLQPTQPQAGAVPLTDEHIRAMLNKHPPEDVCGWSYRMGIDDAELHHGIKGGQHGTE